LITQAAFLTPALDAALTPLSALAPLHNPSAFQWLHGCRDLFGHDCQQMLVPDTAFFRALPVVAQTYALPAALCERYQLKRYGFHGLAHEAMWRAWEEAGPRASPSRIITLQLGGGSSMAAIVDGRPVDTTMGFTPLEGLVMATRCGDMDPGLLLWLQQHAGMDVATLDRLLHEQSGLLGMSGISGDMQVLLASDDAAASRAINVFVYRIRKYLGAFIAVLGGVDGILFGGGIGEHAAQIRGRILQNMSWAGIEIDPLIGSPAMSSPAMSAPAMSGREMLQRQGGASHAISPPNAPVEVRVVAIDEARLLVQALVSGLLSTPD
jgi:acetate kinase